jgi:alanyl-tRNA synthetase
MLLEINKYLEKENNVITKDNKELRQQLEMNQSETEKLLNKIKSLEEKTNELQKKNDELQKTIYKKDKELSHKECQSSSTKNIKTGNVASDKMFKEEIIEITNKKIEIENIDTTKKLLFVGGYIPTIRKLKTVYKNSENIMNCSAICSANYIKSFDGIVFFTNFISHSLYEKIKNVAKSNNCKWIHCHSDNIDLIVKEINKSFVEKTSQAV